MGSFVHCPSCGAPAKDQFCEYCGTPLFTTRDLVAGARGKRCHVWYEESDGSIFCFDMFVHDINIDEHRDMFYSDNGPVLDVVTSTEADISGKLVDFIRSDWAKLFDWHAILDRREGMDYEEKTDISGKGCSEHVPERRLWFRRRGHRNGYGI